MTLLLLFRAHGPGGPVVIHINLIAEYLGTFDNGDTGLTFDSEVFSGTFDIADWQ